MMLYGLLAVALVIAFLCAVIVSQWSYQRSLKQSNITLHKRASSAEMALFVMQRVNQNISDLEKVQHAQTVQATQKEHLIKRVDFESGWLSDGTDPDLSTHAKSGSADASDIAEHWAG